MTPPRKANKTDRAAFMDYMGDLATMGYPTDPDHVAALHAAAITNAAKWANFRLFLVYTFTTYGTFGKRAFAAQETLAGDYGVSRPTVRKWLDAAEALGLINRVAEATIGRGAEYWLSCHDVPAEAEPEAVKDEPAAVAEPIKYADVPPPYEPAEAFSDSGNFDDDQLRWGQAEGIGLSGRRSNARPRAPFANSQA